ncbi:CARDB domain-containing protein [Aphanothece sacrum]|uniref:Phosphoesterase PA-phosphatase related protein n=1 Tax=Aphanothece sacrum FPU1 TaxID=1920663 RepID=A0A401IF49_APHSA|nr:CARDB domain-containing protein [Aphanothece sacrum]GBF79851.1 phosphoesterase PA-phosphatase related protein [Aphanothece sacrum FPU1]GBF86347.1 phosphoesterase [Aphanothece sacrum FPU3]
MNKPDKPTRPAQTPDLSVKFKQVDLPDSVDFGALGQAEIVIKNDGKATATGPVTIKLYASTDGELGKNDVLLSTTVENLNLAKGKSTNLTIDYANNTSAIAPGSYHIIAKVDTENQIIESNEDNNIASKLVSAPNTDVVLDWQAVALNAIQAEGKAGRGVAPTVGSRLLATFSTAIHDTVQAFENTFQHYKVDTVAPVGACLEAAVVGAAYRVLSTQLGPAALKLIDEQRDASLKEIKDRPIAETIGYAFGQSIADQIIASRANDGANNTDPYVPPTGDYVWKPDAPNFAALGPKWGQVIPWAIPFNANDPTNSFAPDGLDGTPTNNPNLYATEIEEVRQVGGLANTDVTTLTRTPDQTELAVFWAYDRPDTFRPYGQLSQIAQEVAVREGNSLAENARLFAALNVALADAAIVAWDAKYDYTQPRPDDVIAGGIALNDGIASTIHDPNWKPLLGSTPPFPDYISGHSTFGGAFAGVLTNLVGDNYAFDAVSQELPGVVRSFNSFYEAGVEDAVSRVYGGVHVREASVTDAVPTGYNIGEYVATNFFQAITDHTVVV